MPTCEERIYGENYVDVLTDFPVPLPREEMPLVDYCYSKISDFLGVVYVNRENVPPLSFSEYTYRFVPKLYGPMELTSYPLLKSGILQSMQPPLSLTGKNVVIGIVDSGIDYTNPAFQKEDGSSRILALWDQTIAYGGEQNTSNWNDDSRPKVNSADVPFGTVYNQEEINQALRSGNPLEQIPSVDETGHGTAIASCAGGFDENVYGGAIDAEFVIVKCKQAKQYLRDYYQVANQAIAYEETDLMFGCKFIDSFCNAFERPVVFAIGVGSNMGAHDGSSLFSEYLDDLARKRGRAVVVAGGNQGNSRAHFTGEGSADAEIRVGEDEKGFSMEIWGEIPRIMTMQITSPGGESTPFVRIDTTQTNIFRFIYEKTILYVDTELVEQSSGKELIFVRFTNPTAGIWRVQIRNAGVFDMWLPITSFLSAETFFLEASPLRTLTEPAYARDVITVSTYQDENNAFWGESGRGKEDRRDNKPDLAAPGVDIPVSDKRSVTGIRNATGSSLAAGIMAGAVAQFLQWAVIEGNDAYIKGQELKSFFQLGAARDAEETYPNNRWGYGRLNLYGVFERLAGR